MVLQNIHHCYRTAFLDSKVRNPGTRFQLDPCRLGLRCNYRNWEEESSLHRTVACFWRAIVWHRPLLRTPTFRERQLGRTQPGRSQEAAVSLTSWRNKLRMLSVDRIFYSISWWGCCLLKIALLKWWKNRNLQQRKKLPYTQTKDHWHWMKRFKVIINIHKGCIKNKMPPTLLTYGGLYYVKIYK